MAPGGHAVTASTPDEDITVTVDALARDLTGDMVPCAAAAGIDLGFTGSPALARAEPVLLAEALKNLIDNALAYAGAGAVVTVAVAQEAQAVRLTVEDDGPGIPAAARARLTARFARGASGQEGLGLGMPIVAEIAALFGGELRLAEGAGGRGLRAELRLPAALVPT